MDLTFSGGNNHINGYSYDAAGNLTYDGGHTYFYDAEHHLVQVDGSAGYCQSGAGTQATSCYTYDAEGRRVRRTVPGSGITDDYIYDLGGRAITQMSGGGWWIRGEIYAGGRHLATYENDLGTPTTFFPETDWLGTERVQTAVNGTACETITSLPFGDGLSTSGSCDPSALYFTGKIRDWETGLDNFGVRYNASQIGRFMSPDPLLNSGRPSNPQTWNRYTYALNNPLNIIDPTGLYDLVNNCATDNKKCNKQFNQHAKDLRNGLTNLQNQLKNVTDPMQKARLEAALKAFGTEGDNNGVNVTFGATKGGGAGETDAIYDSKTNAYSSFNVTLDPSKLSGQNEYAIASAHEGIHVSDYENYELNPATAMTLFQLEYRGYQTSVFAASTLGYSSFSTSYDGRSYPMWNGSWGAVDRNITNFVTKFHDKNGQQTAPETIPHNPQPN